MLLEDKIANVNINYLNVIACIDITRDVAK